MKHNLKTKLFGVLCFLSANNISFCSSIEDYSKQIEELKTELIQIYQQYLSRPNNIAILETLLNKLLKNDYQLIIKQDLDTKKNIIKKIFDDLNLKNESMLTSWNLDDFIKQSEKITTKIDLIKATLTANFTNIVFIEIILKNLFGVEYSKIIKDDFKNKKTYVENKLNKLEKLKIADTADTLEPEIKNTLEPETALVVNKEPIKTEASEVLLYDVYDDSRTGPLIPQEENSLKEMKADTAHFKDLKIVDGQRQKNATCGSHAIINAWAIEQLLKDHKEITAANIFEITAPYFIEGSEYPIDRFIHSEEVCEQIPKFIEKQIDQTDFKNRLNFLSYYYGNVIDRRGFVLEEVGVHLTDKFTSDKSFEYSFRISDLSAQYKALLARPPHVEHFLFNSRAHWVLASVVQEPGKNRVIYYIDSLGGSPLSKFNPKVARFVISLYENFVKR